MKAGGIHKRGAAAEVLQEREGNMFPQKRVS